MGLVAATAGLFALGAYLGRNVSYGWGWVFFVGALLALIGVNVAARRSEQAAITLALIVFGIVAIFIQIPHGALIYAIAGLVIFAGLTAFDFQRLRRTDDIRTAPLLAASIFLDLLNVFLLLSIFGGRDD